MTLREKVLGLPLEPGVYIFKDNTGKVIYVGKAKQLKLRVSSYFHSGILPGTKTYALVSRISDLEFIQVETELEALVLESTLIKKYSPHYNIIQKDDKSYLFIVIRTETYSLNDKKIKLANIFTARETDLRKGDKIFGPYPDGSTAKEILKKLRTLFPFKDCSTSKYKRFYKLQNPCLYGHLSLCPAPCVNNSDYHITLYKKSIESLVLVLKGRSHKVTSSLRSKMEKASAEKKYEEAAYYRDTLNKYKYVSHTFRDTNKYVENPYLLDDVANKALEDLVEMIPILSKKPERVECYDISNLSGKEAVGSLVVALNGKVEKKEYKKFRIKSKNTPDDFHMLQEVLTRRLSHSVPGTKKAVWPLPDLLLIDGGRGQVAAVNSVVRSLGLNIPVVGIAKQFEHLVYTTKGNLVEAAFSKESAGMKLVIRLRDEAHRFAQSYHHKLREKRLTT